MLDPAKLKGSWLPTMPEDVLKMAQDVMGGRWYRCPNGHPFYVDLCGRPTQINSCAECGAQIGGLNHDLLSTNEDIGNVGTDYYQSTSVEDKSEPDYCLRPASDEASDRFLTARALNPTSLRAARYLLHSAMVVGGAALGEAWSAATDPLVNKAYASLPEPRAAAQAAATGAKSLAERVAGAVAAAAQSASSPFSSALAASSGAGAGARW